MAEHRVPNPDDVPRSPTGRIPQWVMDEAAGRPTGPVPFRASSGVGMLDGAAAAPRRSRRGRRLSGRAPGWRVAFGVTIVVALSAVMQFGLPRSLTKDVAWLNRGTHSTPPYGVEESAARLLPPVSAPPAATGSYAFIVTEPGTSTPVRWSPCRPVHYVIRSQGTIKGGKAMIDEAFAALSAATGLQFINEGATSEPPTDLRAAYQPERYGKRWAPVLVAWAAPDEVLEFTTDVAGLAGPIATSTPSGDGMLASGTFYLDPDKLRDIRKTHGAAEASNILVHELGHLAGLAHVNDSTQLMFPTTQSGVIGYQDGDRAGLAILGQGPCQPDA
ncbi:MAG: matrixin family metalloprotease [Candidatus Nanopelagicales bacterium]